MSDLYLFVHINKTGGQSFRYVFQNELKLHDTFIHLGPFGFRDTKKKGIPRFERRPLKDRMRAQVILGHHVTTDTHRLVPEKNPRYVVFLRNPAARIVSQYNFQMFLRRKHRAQPTIDFQEWYQKLPRNFVSSFIHSKCTPHSRFRPTTVLKRISRKITYASAGHETRLRMINAALKRFWFVGVTERIDLDGPKLLRAMGLSGHIQRRNVSGKDFKQRMELDDNLERKLNSDNPLDYQLYRYWKERNEQSPFLGDRNE
jgi:hypothetical protein